MAAPQRFAQLERRNRDPGRADVILRSASALLAKLDRPSAR